jgi:hypothetical protein
VKGAITSLSACGVAGGTSFSSTGTIALIQEASEVASLGLSSHPKNIDVTEVFTLTCTTACGFDETGFLTWSDQFEESPEPSTFILLGTALAGIALLRLRSHRADGTQ